MVVPDRIQWVLVCFFVSSLVGYIACLLLVSFFSYSSSSSFLLWITCTGSSRQGSSFLALDLWRGWALMGDFFFKCMHALCKPSRSIMDFCSFPHTPSFFLSFFSLPLFLSLLERASGRKRRGTTQVIPPLVAIFDWLLECLITARVLCSLAGWFAS